MKRWNGPGSIQAFKKQTAEMGAYWVRIDEDDEWQVMMLSRWHGKVGRGTRMWGECDNCGECFFDELVCGWEVVGPIPTPC